MKKNIDLIAESFKQSMEDYDNFSKSKHWIFFNNKKKNLFDVSNLEFFRKNGLSNGLDDKSPDINHLTNYYKYILQKCGIDFVYNNLEINNVGFNDHYIKIKKYFIDLNFLSNLEHFYYISKKINLKKIKIICEIGGGFGQLSKIFLNNHKTKYILIDLPETNFISSYYLMENFKDLNFLLYSQTNKKFIDDKAIENFDVIIIPPWVKLKNTKVDLFINIRSMMEMNYNTIKNYFHLIHKNISTNGFFVNFNRYQKNTTGESIEFHKYPYDSYWQIISSEPSQSQKIVHQLITKRTKKIELSLSNELKRIKNIMQKLKQ